jgi:hypothetical protein
LGGCSADDRGSATPTKKGDQIRPSQLLELLRLDEGEETMSDTPKKPILLYLQLTFVFSAVVWTLIIWSGHLYMGFGLMIPAIMWCPALAAVVTCRMLG